MELKYQVCEIKYSNIKEVLRDYFCISDRLLTKLKKSNQIYLNDVSTYVHHPISLNDIISVDLDFEEESENITPKEMDLHIIFEDDALLIINKDPNMPVHPSILHFEDSLSNGVRFYFDKIGLKRKIRPVNRLDKDTSGIVIFAKNEYVQESLVRQMKNNTFKKEYLAILTEYLDKSFGTIEAPISRKENSIIEREINQNGEKAITHFELIKTFEKYKEKLSLVRFVLETGRTHQIRLHSKFIGHSILGDSLYGSPSKLISRQSLHAYKVSFMHPITKEFLKLEVPLPDDMANLIVNN